MQCTECHISDHIVFIFKLAFPQAILPVERQAFGFSVEYVPPPSPEDGNRSSFRNVAFSVCRNPDDGQSPEA
jgi:hypothetical protein